MPPGAPAAFVQRVHAGPVWRPHRIIHCLQPDERQLTLRIVRDIFQVLPVPRRQQQHCFDPACSVALYQEARRVKPRFSSVLLISVSVANGAGLQQADTSQYCYNVRKRQ
jgi:hypothetical protein